MNRRLVDALVLLLLTAPLVYLLNSAVLLPDRMASHFNFEGVADGYMPRDTYLVGAALFTVGLPLLFGLVLPALSSRMAKLINLPNRDIWMAPERQLATLDYLGSQYRIFALTLGAFMTAVHALVVDAHRQQPPQLNAPAMQMALGVFLLATAVWVVALLLHFRRPR